MKKLLALLMALTMILSLSACGGGSGTEEPAESTEPVVEETTEVEESEEVEEVEETEEVEEIKSYDISASEDYEIEILNIEEVGSLYFLGIEPAGEELTEAENAYLFKYRFTNLSSTPAEVFDLFWCIYYQNAVQCDIGYTITGADSVIDQYNLISNRSSSALTGGTIEFAQPISLNDPSPITLYAYQRDNSDNESNLIEFVFNLDGASSSDVPSSTSTSVTSNDNITIDGIAVDDSYQDDDGTPLRMVYLFYTVNATDENLKVDSVNTVMTIDDSNEYTSESPVTAAASEYALSYYCSGYLEDVYIGTSLKVMETFKVPEGDLAEGKTIALEAYTGPSFDGIIMSTDDIQHFDDPVALAQTMDPEGYEQAEYLFSPADSETASKVQKSVNGYQWSFTTAQSISYKLEFTSNSTYTLTTSFNSHDGTYEVMNGYLFLHNELTTVKIPYAFEDDGSINLGVLEAYDVKDRADPLQ